MKILLHICCAPCLIYPLKQLKTKGFEVEGLFYNPNIHPFSEYRSRKQAIADLGEDVKVSFPDYNPAEFFQAVNGKEYGRERCSICWKLRLKKTAEEARRNDFTHFTTTLLVSPYQDQELLKKLGDEAGSEAGVEFYYEDFRPGFRKAHDEAKLKGIYCQKYCGCIYSEMERCRKSAKH